MSNIKINSEVEYEGEFGVFIVGATKTEPRRRANMTPLEVPDGYDYLIIPKEGKDRTFFPVYKSQIGLKI